MKPCPCRNCFRLVALLDVAERVMRSTLRNGAPSPAVAEWLREREQLCNPCPFSGAKEIKR